MPRRRKVRVVLMGNMGRPRSVENHARRAEIEKSLTVARPNFSALSRQYGVSRDVLREYRKGFVSEPMQRALATVAQVEEETPALTRDVLAKLDLLVDRGYRMLSACDEWLADPNAPGRYNLNPRTHEVDVVYERRVGDRTVRSTEKLGKLLADVEGKLGITVVRGETKTADPRKLLLEAVATLKPVVELIGKATGQIRPDPAVALNVFLESPDWQRAEIVLLESLRPFPPALEAAGRALATIGGRDDAR